MFVFNELNVAFPKDLYPLSNIDLLIDGSSSYKTLSFIYVYYGYNSIKIGHIDAPKIIFMSNQGNYYYNVMPFGLKNAYATYQRLMDVVFSKKIRCNLKYYINEMIVKTSEEKSQVVDLEDILESARSYNMRLNPAKCSFDV